MAARYDPEEAVDLVQDAMTQLVLRYRDRSEEEFTRRDIGFGVNTGEVGSTLTTYRSS